MSQQIDKTYGKPLVYLKETNPWLMVIGSDTPTFVIYENGQIIYKKVGNNSVKIYEVKLSKLDLEKTINSLSISDKFYQLSDNIEATNWEDQPQNIIYLDLHQKKSVNVYGRLENNEARKKTPQEFLTIYDNIKSYENSNAKERVPPIIEVMFWDYNYAPKSKPWLKNFPDLKSSTTKIHGDMFSVFLNHSQFEEFKKFYKTLEEKQAVLINGKKMAISYRFPFPNF